VFVGVAGLAVDAARGYLLKSRLSAAVDAAALAGGKALLETDTRDGIIKTFFSSNLPAGAMGATIATPSITYGSNNTEVTVTANATMPTAMMRVLGFNTMNVQSSATVSRAITGLDVVFSVDMSWSMCQPCSKIAAAQQAAEEMVDALYKPFDEGVQQQMITVNGKTYSMLNVGVVPWNAKVNVSLSTAAPGYAAFDSTKTTSKSAGSFTNPVLGTTQSVVYYANSSPVPNNLTNRLLWLASNIKAGGVKVYVIQYEENDADLTSLLKQVASGTGSPFYYYAPDPASLDAIFAQIASSLSALRIVK